MSDFELKVLYIIIAVPLGFAIGVILTRKLRRRAE